jgi:carboxyl-terminal processing protease
MTHKLRIACLLLSAAVFAAAQEPDPAAVPPAAVPAVEASDTNDEAYNEIRLFTEALLQIRRRYPEEKTYREIVRGGLHGLLQNLDPHSDFLEADAYRALRDDAASQFSGIGISIGVRNGRLTVIAPMEETPAFRAGILAGDVIAEIDGAKTQSMTLRQAVERLRGEANETVQIKVLRAEEDELRTFDLTREVINVESVKGLRMLRDGIGYVRLTQFSVPTGPALAAALDRLKTLGARALVLDLRDNPGGLLRSAVEVAELFLKRGDLIVTTRGRPGVYDPVHSVAQARTSPPDWPLAILINGGSASASEIVAGALQDHRRAVLVGQTSFGKASVQSVINLEADETTALRLTVGHYFTPKDRAIHGQGIAPDIEVPLSVAQWRDILTRRAHIETPNLYDAREIARLEHIRDPQLERAADILQSVLILK